MHRGRETEDAQIGPLGRTGTVSSDSGEITGNAVGEPEFVQVGNVAVRGHKDNGEVYEAGSLPLGKHDGFL